MENKLDGNAAGGMLQAIFPFEMTEVRVACVGCDMTGVIGSLAAYIHGMGTVLRCPACDHVMIRVARTPGRYLLDMQGVRMMEITTAEYNIS